jgi:hypothetical protein
MHPGVEAGTEYRPELTGITGLYFYLVLKNYRHTKGGRAKVHLKLN